ncbi:MAG: class I SAM-dependent methyltransferase [Spirochaetales bacterium]|nr:class I SAM-dependent methyltransferase [Spirochaetales bacterium]
MSILTTYIKNIIFTKAENDFIAALVKQSEYSKKTLKKELQSIKRIHQTIPCSHGYFEFLILYGIILTLPVKGPVIEFGCYKGGSSAKLSLLCKLTGRKLHIFDSFEGLPDPEMEDQKHHVIPWIDSRKEAIYKKGLYSGSLDEVKNNITKYGCIDVCSFVKGYFDETLPSFTMEPACICMDVDYIKSAKTVLKYMWPQLKDKGILFTHEAGVIEYIKGITDNNWWEQELYQSPPLLFGAGYGINFSWHGFSFPSSTAYFIKNK